MSCRRKYCRSDGETDNAETEKYETVGSSELKTKVDLLKDMAPLREDKSKSRPNFKFILFDKEIESICIVCKA